MAIRKISAEDSLIDTLKDMQIKLENIRARITEHQAELSLPRLSDLAKSVDCETSRLNSLIQRLSGPSQSVEENQEDIKTCRPAYMNN